MTTLDTDRPTIQPYHAGAALIGSRFIRFGVGVAIAGPKRMAQLARWCLRSRSRALGASAAVWLTYEFFVLSGLATTIGTLYEQACEVTAATFEAVGDATVRARPQGAFSYGF